MIVDLLDRVRGRGGRRGGRGAGMGKGRRDRRLRRDIKLEGESIGKICTSFLCAASRLRGQQGGKGCVREWEGERPIAYSYPHAGQYCVDLYIKNWSVLQPYKWLWSWSALNWTSSSLFQVTASCSNASSVSGTECICVIKCRLISSHHLNKPIVRGRDKLWDKQIFPRAYDVLSSESRHQLMSSITGLANTVMGWLDIWNCNTEVGLEAWHINA